MYPCDSENIGLAEKVIGVMFQMKIGWTGDGK